MQNASQAPENSRYNIGCWPKNAISTKPAMAPNRVPKKRATPRPMMMPMGGVPPVNITGCRVTIITARMAQAGWYKSRRNARNSASQTASTVRNANSQ